MRMLACLFYLLVLALMAFRAIGFGTHTFSLLDFGPACFFGSLVFAFSPDAVFRSSLSVRPVRSLACFAQSVTHSLALSTQSVASAHCSPSWDSVDQQPPASTHTLVLPACSSVVACSFRNSLVCFYRTHTHRQSIRTHTAEPARTHTLAHTPCLCAALLPTAPILIRRFHTLTIHCALLVVGVPLRLPPQRGSQRLWHFSTASHTA